MLDIQYEILKRPRRNRFTSSIRNLIQETHLKASDLVFPCFIVPGEKQRHPILQMPGIERLSIDYLTKEAEWLHTQGIQAISLFPVINPVLKDERGSEAWNENGLVPLAIKTLKKELPSLCVISDIALDPYTSHGHDGVINHRGEIDNDLTLSALIKQALTYANAGCDILAPSDMMDGRIKIIREALDEHCFTNTGLLSYAVKYASSFYAPFRNAIQTKVQFGDKKTYQMNPANSREAVRESLLDEEEGADMLLIKPALPFLDVISKVKEKTSIPIGAFQVSGEYSMIMAAAQNGWLNAEQTFYESLIGIKRAGADFIFTYAVKLMLDILNSK